MTCLSTFKYFHRVHVFLSSCTFPTIDRCKNNKAFLLFISYHIHPSIHPSIHLYIPPSITPVPCPSFPVRRLIGLYFNISQCHFCGLQLVLWLQLHSHKNEHWQVWLAAAGFSFSSCPIPTSSRQTCNLYMPCQCVFRHKSGLITNISIFLLLPQSLLSFILAVTTYNCLSLNVYNTLQKLFYLLVFWHCDTFQPQTHCV